MNVPAMTKPAPHELPFYSIVIPVYNEEDVVGGVCLNGSRNFRRQPGSGDYELLLVDNDSADRTAEIVGNVSSRMASGKVDSN